MIESTPLSPTGAVEPAAKTSTHPTSAGRAPRIDGVEARARLLHAALRLFAAKGFANTSTRELAGAAGVNIASISYYFGDKTGLYRAAYTEPLGSNCGEFVPIDSAQFSLEQVLRQLLTQFVEPLKQGDLVQLCMRLHFREMLEPTGLWAEEIDNGLRPAHATLVQALCVHLQQDGQNLTEDDDIHRLAFSIVGLAVHMFIGRDTMQLLRPQLQADAAAIDTYTNRLLDYALAMVASEKARRSKASHSITTKS